MKRKSAHSKPSRKTLKKRVVTVARRASKPVRKPKPAAKKKAKVAIKHKPVKLATFPKTPAPRFARHAAYFRKHASATKEVTRAFVRSLEAPPSMRAVVACLVVAAAILATTAGVIRSVSAATYQGPSQAAPGGNIPFTIWNRTASTVVQTNAAVAIDGGGPAPATSTGVTIGLNASNISTLDLGSAASGQNVFYGVATYAGMNAGDALLKLETYAAGFATRFTVDKDGNVSAAGKIKAAGCFGATFAGVTAASYHGSLGATGSYYAADNRCRITFAGSHVCRPDEILESISCSVPGDPIRTIANGTNAWINGGPPGHTSNGNDCNGWQDNTSGYLGKFWIFNQTTGGTGTMTTCDVPSGLKYACCL